MKVGADITKGEMHKVTFWLVGFLVVVGANQLVNPAYSSRLGIGLSTAGLITTLWGIGCVRGRVSDRYDDTCARSYRRLSGGQFQNDHAIHGVEGPLRKSDSPRLAVLSQGKPRTAVGERIRGPGPGCETFDAEHPARRPVEDVQIQP